MVLLSCPLQLLLWSVGLLVFYVVGSKKVSAQTSLLSFLSVCPSDLCTLTFGLSLRVSVQWSSFLSFFVFAHFHFWFGFIQVPDIGAVSQSVVSGIHSQMPFTSRGHCASIRPLNYNWGSLLISTLWLLSPLLSYLSYLFIVCFLCACPGFSSIKEPHIRALKTLLVTHGLKVKTHDLDQFGEKATILHQWISPENIWDPDLWKHILFLTCMHEVQSRITLPLFFVPIFLAVIANLKNSSPGKLS